MDFKRRNTITKIIKFSDPQLQQKDGAGFGATCSFTSNLERLGQSLQGLFF